MRFSIFFYCGCNEFFNKVHSIRAGDIVGDHIVLYAGTGERIEFKHQAHSRNCFASGAITAIKFIANAQENKIYSTREVLDL